MSSDEAESDDTYGDKHFRTDPSGDRRVTIGPLSFVVVGVDSWSDKLARLGVEIEKYPPRLHNDDAAALAEVERQLRAMHKDLANHFAPLLRWERHKCRALVGEWWLFANDHKWSIGTMGNGASVVVRHGESDGLVGCRRAAEAALRALGVTFRTDTESDAATELVMEPVPAPRGRVVARWFRTHPDASYLDAGLFEIRLTPDPGRGWTSTITTKRWMLTDFAIDRARAGERAVEYIRSLIAPFGGELVVEGEP